MSRILFVDDDAGMRVLMKRVLSFEFEAEAAGSSAEALQILEASTEPFAVVVADMSMAHGDGVQLLAEFRKRAPETARILLSGDHRVETNPDLTREAEVHRILLKPIDNPTIMAAIRQAVDRYQGHHPAVAA